MAIAAPRRPKKPRKHCLGNTHSLAPGRRRADRVKPISTKKLSEIVVPYRPAYPLNCPLTLTVQEARECVVVYPSDLPDLEELRATGPVLRQALEDFGRRFDQCVRRYWRVPPHLRTDQNSRVVRVLERLVDWDRYDAENPIVQPMWGRILEFLPSGALRIFWVIGPHEIENGESVLPKRDVVPALIGMGSERWFYGTARCYADRVAWIEPPEPAPSPDDEQARALLWQGLPAELANEPGSWPLTQP